MSSIIESAVSLAVSISSALGGSSLIAKKLHVEGAQHRVKIERKASFTTRDGVRLSADIFHPADLKKSPSILVRIPFSETVETCFLEEVIGRLWAERGWTAVIQGTRGRFKSGGEFYPLLFEREDGIETLDWLAKQPWYNGEIGAWGGSAYGQTLWSIADQTAPAIGTMELYFTSTDFHRMLYVGNAFSLYTALGWTFRSHDKHKDEEEWPTTARIIKAASRWPMKDADSRDLGHSVAFFQDWIRHKNFDKYWRQIDGDKQSSKFHGPVLFLAGWFDPFLQTELADFGNASSMDVTHKTRIVIGPWSHARDVELPNFRSNDEKFRSKSVASSISWFKETLGKEALSKRNSTQDEPKVSIFVMGANQWRAENEWPLARTKYTPFFLNCNGHGNGKLTAEAPARDFVDQFTYDPENPVPTVGGAMIGSAAGMFRQNVIEQRADVFTYTTSPMEQDTEITGPVKLTLYVSSDAPCTDFTAKLIDVHADGNAYNLCSGILRKSYFSNGLEKSTPVKIEIDLTATSNVFKKGHRIRLDVSSSDFPRFDRNPNTGHDPATEKNSRAAHQQIYSGPKCQSQIILPITPVKSANSRP
ncbi:MAG: CocE/NonD family hydrolase [Cyanobacteria bacterium SZAS-4]|nr:CocE/NonD family hydrolase [Cyanobacteria bacterium SZAS-4]